MTTIDKFESLVNLTIDDTTGHIIADRYGNYRPRLEKGLACYFVYWHNIRTHETILNNGEFSSVTSSGAIDKVYEWSLVTKMNLNRRGY